MIYMSIADNTNANLETTWISNMPHVECYNHKFNLDIKNITENKKSLENTMSDIK